MSVPTPLSALVVAKSLDDRILLRALLRIHHVAVDTEAEGAAQALQLLRSRVPTHLVLDSDIADGTIPGLIAEARRLCPLVRIVLLTRSSGHVPLPSEAMGPSVVQLTRPFRFRQFAEAIGVDPGPGAS